LRERVEPKAVQWGQKQLPEQPETVSCPYKRTPRNDLQNKIERNEECYCTANHIPPLDIQCCGYNSKVCERLAAKDATNEEQRRFVDWIDV